MKIPISLNKSEYLLPATLYIFCIDVLGFGHLHLLVFRYDVHVSDEKRQKPTVQSQKQTRSLKFLTKEDDDDDELHYLWTCLCFRICKFLFFLFCRS